MKTTARWLAAATLFMLYAPSLSAQNQHANQARGFNANGVYSRLEVDSVNVFNGNLILRVPIGNSYPVSGTLSYSLNLFYNSNLWSQREVCDSSVNTTYEHRYSTYASEIHINGINVTIIERDEPEPRGTGDGCYTFNHPNPAANAGMGWQMTLGKLYNPRDGLTDERLTTTERLEYVYQGPDGSEHAFYSTLHVGEADDAAGRVWYTRDNSYLRMFWGDATDRRLRIEFPSGERHYFEPKVTAIGVEFRVTRIEDQLGNYVTVEYMDYDGDHIDDQWFIRDSVGRQQEVSFLHGGEHYQNVVRQVKLLAPGGQTATYTLNYTFQQVERALPYVADLQGYPQTMSLPFLTSVVQPDGSQYSMPVSSYDLTGESSSSRYKGIIKSMTLPTGAQVEWQYRVPGMERTEGYGYFYPRVAAARSYHRTSVGVRRRVLTVDGRSYVWKYDPRPELPPGYPCSTSSLDPACSPKEFVNTVTTPQGDRTVHYFSVFPHPFDENGGRPEGKGRSETEWHAVEYGLPLTKYLHGRADFLQDAGSPSLPLFLSTQTYSGEGTPDDTSDDVLKRSEYVRYETDRYPVSDGWGNHLDTNARLAVKRTVYHDDVEGGVARFTELRRSNFDGLGHYRREETGGNFDGDENFANDSRAVLVNYNPTRGEYRLDPQTNTVVTGYTPYPEGEEWLLGLYNQTVVRDNKADAKAVAEFHFDDNGLLRRKRTYKQTSTAALAPSRSARDVVVLYDYSAGGDLTRERFYGGDKRAGLGTAALPNLTLPDFGYEYGIEHEYAAGGVLKTSRYIRVNGSAHAPVSFKSVDRDIDERTGLMLVERDTAEDPVAYSYDQMWRLTRIQPRQGSRTDISYVRRGGTLPGGGAAQLATVFVSHRPNGGGSPLDEEKYEYDGFGRLTMEWMSLPRADGTSYLTSRQTLYNGMGWKTSVSEWGSSQKKTEYLSFDPFGRPRTVRAPDGKEVSYQYFGARRLRRNVWGVVTPSATPGVGQERNAVSWEYSDAHGRLVEVSEPSGLNDQLVSTFYRYDEGNRLAGVATTASVLETSGATSTFTQSRALDYDGIGNLLSETHPEVGAGGNGAATYGDFDTRGHVGLKTHGQSTLRYTYDVVERPLLVEERVGTTYRPLKSYGYYGLYDNRPSENSYVGGKLAASVRHNYVNPWGGAAVDVVVTERYEYRGLDGKMSKRRTEVSPGGNFEQSFVYGPLGNLTSQSYPQCAADNVNCAPVATPRNVSNEYQRGLLRRVYSGASNYASAIDYHDNGALASVALASGVSDTFGKDPNFMARPASIQTRRAGAATPLRDSGTYAYDGAGNISRVGADWYFYDLVGRLREGTLMALRQKQTYRYDAFANLRQIATREGVGLSWERPKGSPQDIDTDASTNRLRNVTYDAQGNATGQPAAPMFTYDALNMMKTAPNRVYVYGPGEERVWVFDQTTGARVETVTLRGRSGEVLREYQVAGGNWGWVRDYVYRGAKLLATETPGGRFYYHLDHLGTPRLLTNGAGNLVSTYHYFPFGSKELTYSSQDADRVGFGGHEQDANPGAVPLTYMHARYYHFTAGKFLSVDPKAQYAPPVSPQRWNRYAYAANNPLKFVDPDGREIQIYTGAGDPDFAKEVLIQYAMRKTGRNVLTMFAMEKDVRVVVGGASLGNNSANIRKYYQTQTAVPIDTGWTYLGNSTRSVREIVILFDSSAVNFTSNFSYGGDKSMEAANVCGHEFYHAMGLRQGLSPQTVDRLDHNPKTEWAENHGRRVAAETPAYDYDASKAWVEQNTTETTIPPPPPR